MKRIRQLIQSPWLRDGRVLFALWTVLGIVGALAKLRHHNNYDIFRYVFYNTWNGMSLYRPSVDGGYWDTNHYGPFFATIIAPFAVLPEWLGLLLWDVCLAVFLYWAVSLLCKGLSRLKVFIVWFCAHELLTALFMQQFNIAIAAIIILSYCFVEKERDEYATFFIVTGTLVKLYGIVGLAFFFFSRHKARFILSLLLWSVVLFVVPMAFSSPEYQFQQYAEWYQSLSGKNEENILSAAQNISIMGMITKIGYGLTEGHGHVLAVMHDGAKPNMANWWVQSFSMLWVMGAGCVIAALGYFRIPQWKNRMFRMNILAMVLMFVVLFSTGSESSGYITPFIGCCIWYCCVPWQRGKWDTALLIAVFIISSMSPSDLFPAFIRRDWIQPYALKALPVTLVWLRLSFELMTRDYREEVTIRKQ